MGPEQIELRFRELLAEIINFAPRSEKGESIEKLAEEMDSLWTAISNAIMDWQHRQKLIIAAKAGFKAYPC